MKEYEEYILHDELPMQEVAPDEEELDLLEDEPEGPMTFEAKLEELREFSQQVPSTAGLPTVPSKWLGIFDSYITGRDLNRLSHNIETKMVEQNKLLLCIVQEFYTVYETFSRLNEDYIKKIIQSVDIADRANDKAEESLATVLQQAEDLRQVQLDIKDLLQNDRQVLAVLNAHKGRIGELDQLQSDVYAFQSIARQDMGNLAKQFHQWEKEAERQAQQQESLLEGYERLDRKMAELQRKLQLYRRLLVVLSVGLLAILGLFLLRLV